MSIRLKQGLGHAFLAPGGKKKKQPGAGGLLLSVTTSGPSALPQVPAGTAPRTLPYMTPRASRPSNDRRTRMNVLAHASMSHGVSPESLLLESTRFHRVP